MRFVSVALNGRRGLAVDAGAGRFVGRYSGDPEYPGDLNKLIEAGHACLSAGFNRLLNGPAIDMSLVRHLPPIGNPGKIICVGLNYLDHTSESGFDQPDYPALFTRVNSSLIAHGDPIVRPSASEQLDYEGELVAIIGRYGRHIPQREALDYVAGYSIFNDASIRDYQNKTPQWTIGKNFDSTGAFGPIFVTADELPPGCSGLKLETRLNGAIVQSAAIDSMVFDVATQISIISEAMTLEPGDLIVTGTPSGVGVARKPPLWMKPGDICEVEIEKIGVLRNPVAEEAGR
ncbi:MULTISPECIES: fumarylacetoacetate hydrolase family protein [unclassified Bradyrhizobium]|uniref:fumarylacetoacetate hydrolase family protein n=1 Tax=unclassified Bradyrhizobium TaxID=2631580 RepID=UPI0024794AE9|nr:MULTISPECIES: fumarylacetoacetate hydrolase family protein [unclassified Bradyrhizobium]WGR73160.1 fumarylacetoacetate hydrolase family protein [Bradyrhizobium sp. ISRA426]WGR78000.1 fumarylacetoacetate hydrolase family protein [Bradyrhizobium sp. ISRA430]WGR88401.1 fumarylacetoacetate hydrolase family protein [Bradyrhizobium sp. ISRA432]